VVAVVVTLMALRSTVVVVVQVDTVHLLLEKVLVVGLRQKMFRL
jgi:hypothetical protein